jgi:hypothetical protein
VHMSCRPVNGLMVAAEGAIQDEEVSETRVELTRLTTQTVVPQKKKLQPLQREGTEELGMGVALAEMHMAVAVGDLSGCWP